MDQRHEHRGHTIELRARDDVRRAGPELRIDDRPVDYGQLANGLFYLLEYAYDWSDDLVDVARRFVDYQIRTDELPPRNDPGEVA